MTIKECQEEHKKLWNWIADETEKWGYPVLKQEYFKYVERLSVPRHGCFACQFALDNTGNHFMVNACDKCPIKWNKNEVARHVHHSFCEHLDYSPYRKWLWGVEMYKSHPEIIKELSKLAREIANLPFKEEV